MRKLSESEFDSIVHSVARETYGVLDVSVCGFSVIVRFRTNSGKGSWTSTLSFNEETGYYTYTSPYYGAGKPYALGDRIASRMKEMLND
jgi:hypothetical protein